MTRYLPLWAVLMGAPLIRYALVSILVWMLWVLVARAWYRVWRAWEVL